MTFFNYYKFLAVASKSYNFFALIEAKAMPESSCCMRLNINSGKYVKVKCGFKFISHAFNETIESADRISEFYIPCCEQLFELAYFKNH